MRRARSYLCFLFGIFFLRLWFGKSNHGGTEHAKPAFPSIAPDVVRRTRIRAATSRRVYNLTVVTMIALVLMLVYMFLQTRLTVHADEAMVTLLSIAGVRLGAVVLAIFAIQMIFSFARYHVRLADHLENVADALELASGDAEVSTKFVTAFSPHTIDFGKTPTSPIEKALDVVAEVAKSQRKP